MDFNGYAFELYVRSLVEDARAAAARRALVPRWPAERRLLQWARARYVRWSSAASAGSNPTTARAWSRSR